MADNIELKKQKPKKEKRESNRFVRGRKGIWSELKKVSWPNFPTILKSTGTVLAVVAVFLVMLLAFDLILRYLAFNPLQTGTISGPAEEILTSMATLIKGGGGLR